MPNRKPMTPCERGSWIDTEGYVRESPATLAIAQKHRKPLEDYCVGAIKDGIPCKIRCKTDPIYGKNYEAYITGIENIAKELALTQPYIRTRMRRQQIFRFKRHIVRSRTPESQKAREILKV